MLKKVTKKFRTVTAVRDLSLEIMPGEIYGLIGPNGSGKTTTIKTIAGLYRQTKGTIEVNGLDVIRHPTRSKRGLGYIPDDPQAYDRLSGREFLEFVGQIFGMERGRRDERVAMLLDRYGLKDVAEGAFGQYSRGNRQKISILAALLHEPKLLLIDEPMIGLDPQSARITKEMLREFASAGGAILLSTHTLAVAEELCGRLGILKEGQLIEEGTVAELGRRANVGHGSLEDYYLALTA